MSWCENMCKCGNTVSYGFYHSDYEDELTEINITVLCGQCVRERDGIISQDEDKTDARYEDFKNMVLEEGLKESINFNNVDDGFHSVLNGMNGLWLDSGDEMYIKGTFSILKSMSKTAIRG